MVEKWLLQVEEVMVGSVRKVIGEAFDAYNTTPRKEWVVEWPGQVVICVGCVFWTTEVTVAFKASQGLQVSRIVVDNVLRIEQHYNYM